MSALRRSQHLPGRPSWRPWTVLVYLLLALQVGVALHAWQHNSHADLIATDDDCALCQIVATTLVGPSADNIIAPCGVVIALLALPSHVMPRLPGATASFQSRAPPLSG